MSSYYINKEEKTGEVIYLDYNFNKSFAVSPKAKKKDQIEVNKIVFVSPTLTEKLIKKKIDIKVSKLLENVKTIYDEEEDDDDGASKIRSQLKDAERLKLNIIKNYHDFLGEEYFNLTIEKVELIIEAYRRKLMALKEKKDKEMLIMMLNSMAMEEANENRGRKGR